MFSANIMMFVLAQPEVAMPTDDNFIMWIFSGLKFIAQSINDKNYMPLAGFVIMLLVFFFNKFISPRLNISKAWLPWISAIIGVVGAIGANLMVVVGGGSQPRDWLAAIATGLTLGSAASGLWSMVGKKLVDLVGSKMTKFLDKYIGKPKDGT